MLTDPQRRAWTDDGFFILRGFADPDAGWAMSRALVAAIRADPPAHHAGETAYQTADDLIIMPEARPNPHSAEAEDQISKVFNPHLSGPAKAFAHDARLAAMVAGLLDDEDISVFQSQFILKNSGAWGQPWHQDSFYFPFDLQPQVGVWLAISEATIENGCLSVLPGSHRGDIQTHHPDRRPGANQGYLEVLDLDFAAATPVLMQPGDVLVFHSYLLHRSVDNRAKSRREAMVYHYGRSASKTVAPLTPGQTRILRWERVSGVAAEAA